MIGIDYNKLERLLYEYVDPLEVPGALKAIEEAEVINIVRCGECKYYSLTFECMKDECGIEEPSTWFCADGERRADDEA